MLTTIDIAILGSGGALTALWLVLYAFGHKHAEIFRPLGEREYPLRALYFVGYEAMVLLRYGYKSRSDRRRRRAFEALYGERYAEYYLRVMYAQRATAALTAAVLAVAFYGLTGDAASMAVLLCLSGAGWYYLGTAADRRLLNRSDEMRRDFGEAVSKLALLTSSGMILREAWESVAYTGKTRLYAEMQRAVEEMRNGVPDVDALHNFGARCMIPEIRKFASTLMQGLKKGNSELAYMLKEQSREVWTARKHDVRRQGEKAAGKLLIPVTIIFVGILIMIVVPIFSGIG
ncbi:MAG: type II secretion system F family protein [Oscillospiraceae bacterium]|jgi:tight adherence protein C|nr:type II secretion system F family protein [Oscillospiraceae bacterium]